MKEGDLTVVTACPVYAQGQQPAYKHLHYDIIKELRKRVKESGVSSNHVLVYLEAINNFYVLIPSDWKTVMKMILTMTEYSIQLSDYRETCTIQVGALQQREPPVVVTQLTGKGPHAFPAAQTGCP